MIIITREEFNNKFKARLEENKVNIISEESKGTGTLYRLDKVADINWNEEKFLVDDTIIEADRKRIEKALKNLKG